MKKTALLILTLFSLAMFAHSAHAQEKVPELPAPIQNLVDEGAQIRYLGRDFGLDSWLTVKNGQEQYFYVLPDQSAFMMGVLFDPKGKLVTIDQVQRLRGKGDTLLDSLASDALPASPASDQMALKSPSEQLFSDIEGSNWIPLGRGDTPVIYSFIDPQCPHCHTFINELRTGGYLQDGKIQVRLIPVGFRDETIAQAAFLMASPNPEERWFKHMDGDATALPAKAEINQQGVQRNLAIMQAWKFDATPMIVYRAKDGSVKIVRGKPQDIPGMIADLAAR